MTFKAARRAIAANPAGPFLRVDHFGELITYFPAGGGPPRTVRAHATRFDPENDQETVAEIDREEIWFKVSRDRTAEQANGYDAIDAPVEGDTILRENDPPDAPWSFQGLATRRKDGGNKTPHCWYLQFARHRPTTYR